MRVCNILLLVILCAAFVTAETKISDNMAYVEDKLINVGQEPYMIRSGETANIIVQPNTEEKVFDICFDFKGKQDMVTIEKYEERYLFGLLSNDYKANYKAKDKVCMKSVSYDKGLVIKFSAVYNGKGTLKYDVLAIPSSYNFDFDTARKDGNLIILDPYIVGDLNESNDLGLYLPFNNNLAVSWASTTQALTSSNTRKISYSTYQDLSDLYCSNPNYAYDRTFTTYATPGSSAPKNCEFIWNFKKNSTDTGMKLEVKFATDYAASCNNLRTVNYTIPSSCFSYASGLVKTKFIQTGTAPFTTSVLCEGSTGWEYLFTDGASSYCGGAGYVGGAIYDTQAFMTNQTSYSAYPQSNINATYVYMDGLIDGFLLGYNKQTKSIKAYKTITCTNCSVSYDGIRYGYSKFKTLPNITDIDLGNSFSIVADFKFNKIASQKFLLTSIDTSGQVEFQIQHLPNNKINFRVDNSTTPSNSVNSLPITDTTKVYHLEIRKLNNNLSIYIDNVFMNSTIFIGSVNDTNTNVLIGYRSNGLYWNGTIKKVLFYNTSLSSSAGTATYNNGNFSDNKLGEANKSIYMKNSIIVTNNNTITGNIRSVSFWIQSPAITSTRYIYSTDGITGEYCRFQTTNKIACTLNNTNFLLRGNFNYPNLWTHVVFTYDQSNAKLYINGQLINSTSYTKALESKKTFYIGSTGSIDTSYVGKIDEFMVFSRALSSSEVYQLYQGFNSSVDIVFKDETTSEVNTDLISLDVICPSYAREYQTSSGYLFINGLPNEVCSLRYKSDNTLERFYYMNLTTVSNMNLSLYLLNDTKGTEVTATVYDEQGVNIIPNVYIRYLRYYPANNSFIVVGMAKTDSNGQAKLSMELNTEYYKFMLYYPYSTLKLDTNGYYIYEDAINFQILLDDIIGQKFDDTYNINYNLSYSNTSEKFRYTYSNVAGSAVNSRLDVYLITPTAKTLVNSTTSSSTSGTMYVKRPATNGTYVAQAGVQYSTNVGYVDALTIVTGANKVFGFYGVFIILLLCMIFLFIGIYDISIGLILMPLPIFYGTLIGIISIPWWYALLIEIICFWIAMMVKK